MLVVERVEVGPLLSNSYLVFDPLLREGVLIDAGDEPGKILGMVERSGVRVKAIYATHGHFDHVLAAREVKENLGCSFYIHRGDLDLLKEADKRAKMFLGGEYLPPVEPDGFVEEGDVIEVGGHTLRVLHTPGHSPGSVSYVADGGVFTGDTLFAGSVGRHDFPGGDLDKLIDSLVNKLLKLPDDYAVYPGHGPSTTIGVERLHNPYVGIDGLYRRRGKP